MRLAGLVTAGLAVSNAFLGSNQGNGGGRSEFHKPRSLSENSTNATNSTAPLESSYVSKYPECRADVNTDMVATYNSLYPSLYYLQSNYEVALANSSAVTNEERLNFILEFQIDNRDVLIGTNFIDLAVKYLKSVEGGEVCIDTRPNARYYEQCSADSNATEEQMNQFYSDLYAPLSTEIKSDVDQKLLENNLTLIEDKLNFILDYCITNPFDTLRKNTQEDAILYLKDKNNFGNVNACIDSTTSSSPTSNPTSQPTIDVSQYTDICKADRTQSEADTQAEQYELYRRIHPDYQSGVYTVLTNATSLTEYEKLDSVFEYCIENPGSLYCETAESAYNWLRTDFKLYPYKSCANLGLTESPTLHHLQLLRLRLQQVS